MLVAICGTGATRLRNIGTGQTPVIQAEFPDMLAQMAVIGESPFAAAVSYKDGESAFIRECTEFFALSTEAMLAFFKSKQPPCTVAESLKVVAMNDAALEAKQKPGCWIGVQSV
jgi:hypothetical protein